jgi:hypothetical protein
MPCFEITENGPLKRLDQDGYSSSLLRGYDEPENLLSSIQTFVPQALIRDTDLTTGMLLETIIIIGCIPNTTAVRPICVIAI